MSFRRSKVEGPNNSELEVNALNFELLDAGLTIANAVSVVLNKSVMPPRSKWPMVRTPNNRPFEVRSVPFDFQTISSGVESRPVPASGWRGRRHGRASGREGGTGRIGAPPTIPPPDMKFMAGTRPAPMSVLNSAGKTLRVQHVPVVAHDPP